ncbi:MAG: 1-acyl-sn-glycerol-3-phosphate acyltransferase [Magnetococcales bacterium]|nr:1-acyl-sn-glycerol-3-phosphate acyltransferase [Magnetococcales bacterium]
MIWLRSALFFVFFVLGIVGYATAIVLAWPFSGVRTRMSMAAAWARYNRRILVLFCGLRHVVEGAEHLPPPPFVILSRHESAWETVALHDQLPVFVLVLKKSLLYLPFFGWALKATGQIAIDRGHGVEALRILQREGKRCFDHGVSVLIFPEGTRMSPGERGKFNPGGVMLAMQAGVPIVPVAHNAGDYWRRRSFLKHPGVIRLRIGEPIFTAGISREERRQVAETARRRIETMMDEIRGGAVNHAPPAA